MPKLKRENSEEKYFNGLRIDKENKNVIYSDDKHIYLGKSDNCQYTSVTQLIHYYSQPFNEAFWSAYKACESIMMLDDFLPLKKILLQTKRWKENYLTEYNIDKELFEKERASILEEYEKKRNQACERGTKIHAQLEESFYNQDKNTITKYAGGGNFNIKKGYYELDLETAIYPEFLISYKFDDFLKIAGQIDLLIKEGNDITIADWKTNSKIDKESYYDSKTKKRQMMKFPLDNIQDCNFYHYSLQLSLYAYLLQKINPKFNIKKLVIVHFDHFGNETEYVCDYLKNDVERMLQHYKRDQKIKSELELDKPIIF